MCAVCFCALCFVIYEMNVDLFIVVIHSLGLYFTCLCALGVFCLCFVGLCLLYVTDVYDLCVCVCRVHSTWHTGHIANTKFTFLHNTPSLPTTAIAASPPPSLDQPEMKSAWAEATADSSLKRGTDNFATVH